MEDCAELHDWELVDGCDFTDNIMTVMVLKDDYFAIDSGGSPRSCEESDKGGVDSDNPSYADSDCGSNKFLEASTDNVDFVRMKLPKRNSGGFLPDESTAGRRSLAASETTELGNMEDSVSGTGDPVVRDLRGGSEAVWDSSGGGSEGSESSDSREVAEVGVEGEKRVKIWWKVPMVLLKYCFWGMKPAWSLSMAAAMVAILMLLKKLYRMKRKIRRIPLRIALDDKFVIRISWLRKKISAMKNMPFSWDANMEAFSLSFKSSYKSLMTGMENPNHEFYTSLIFSDKVSRLDARATRLNEAISAVRLTTTIRPSIHAGAATQWAALPTSGAI